MSAHNQHKLLVLNECQILGVFIIVEYLISVFFFSYNMRKKLFTKQYNSFLSSEMQGLLCFVFTVNSHSLDVIDEDFS